LAGAELPPVNAAYGEILAEGSGKQGIPAFDEFVDTFERNDKNGFVGTPMDIRVGMGIPFEPKRSDESLRHRNLGKASARDADLDNSSQFSVLSYQFLAASLSSQPSAKRLDG
jgi:hypothetical protein